MTDVRKEQNKMSFAGESYEYGDSAMVSVLMCVLTKCLFCIAYTVLCSLCLSYCTRSVCPGVLTQLLLLRRACTSVL
jgi:hypothetical protein